MPTDEEVWQEYEKWRDKQYERVVKKEIEWEECKEAIDRRLWRVAGEVRKERRKKLCEEVNKVLQRLFEIVEQIEKVCEEINKDDLLPIGGRGTNCIDTMESLEEVVADTILLFVTLANGLPEWEQEALKWKEKWARRMKGSNLSSISPSA